MLNLFNVNKVGGDVLGAILHSIGTFALLRDTAKSLGALRYAPVRQVLYKQVYFSGIEPMPTVIAIGTLLGMVLITQIANIAGYNAVLIGKVLVWAVVRELGPLFGAIMIIARSSSAIAAELGAMKVRHEMRSLTVMGIDPMDYLVMPRVVGTALCISILAFYFQIGAIIGGMILASVISDVPFLKQFGEMFSNLGLFDVFISLSKSLVFGLFVAGASCYNGLRVKSSVTEIPLTTTGAVMQSLFFILIFDGLITLVSFV
jgi:phospholipid/cholesterol/gamma-HCH transport system permease protein